MFMNSTIDFILHHFNASLILLFFMVIAIPLLVWFMLSLILCKLKKSMNCRVLLICYFIIQLTATFGVVQFVKFNAFDDTLYLSDYTTYHKNDIAISYEFFSSSPKDNSPKYTQPFINAVTERLIDELSTEKYNLIVEGTLQTAEVPLKTAKDLKEKGYRTELCVMAVKPEISYESTILRYENAIAFGQTPRATSKAFE